MAKKRDITRGHGAKVRKFQEEESVNRKERRNPKEAEENRKKRHRNKTAF